jgi:hypothetical protein
LRHKADELINVNVKAKNDWILDAIDSNGEGLPTREDYEQRVKVTFQLIVNFQ